MWYVEYQIADGSGETYRYEGLTKEQAQAIHKKMVWLGRNLCSVWSDVINSP